MADDLWGVGPDARRAARPVVVCAALGVAAFVFTFSAALLLGRGLSGSALAALLLPLALSGALAVGLAVAFVVAIALEQPYGAGRVRRMVPIFTPLAALVALFVYAADPAGEAPRPFAGASPSPTFTAAPPVRVPRRVVSVPSTPPPSKAPAVHHPAPVQVLGARVRRAAPPVTVVVRVVPPVAPLVHPDVVTPAENGGSGVRVPDGVSGRDWFKAKKHGAGLRRGDHDRVRGHSRGKARGHSHRH